MDKTAMFKLSYGLFVLSTAHGGIDNACIINTCMQATDLPLTVTVTVSKSNYTNQLIAASGVFTVSVLDERAKFEVFTRFGFSSGRQKNKFADIEYVTRGQNGVYHLTDMANAYIEAKVINSFDLGTHTMFVAEVTDTAVLSSVSSVTYNFYQSNIKPKPQQTAKSKYVCSVCGFVYEGESMPDDYICPLCKHGKDSFIKS